MKVPEAAVRIRAEKEKDYKAIRDVTFRAFQNEEEPSLVEAIRESEYFIPELSLVAESNGKIVGHIMFSIISLVSDEGETEVLSLAPMSVDPDFQMKGVGKKLMEKGLEECRRLGHRIVVVIGHPEYYPRFGFIPARQAGFEVPFDVPDEAFMVIGLDAKALGEYGGMVEFSPPFDGLT